MDATAILVDNLSEALKQINTYIALGFATAVSAFVLDRRKSNDKTSDPVPIPGGFIPMPPDTAKSVLLGICFVAGVLASYAAESAVAIASSLQSSPEILKAACTYSSVATAPIGFRIIAALLPVTFVIPLGIRTWLRIRKLTREDGRGLITLLGFFIVPYAALAIVVAKLPCGA